MRRFFPAFIAILLVATAPAASANSRSPQVNRRASTACYCQCQARENKRECTKMCEIPKYEGRWWANSCHKRPQITPPKSPESRPRPSSDDDDDDQYARQSAPSPVAIKK